MPLRVVVAAAVLLSACAAAPAHSRLPAPADPGALAGVWRLRLEDGSLCRVTLATDPVGQGFRAAAEACRYPIREWRPVPDGVELAGPDGLTLILLEPAGEGAYAGRDASGQRVGFSR